MGSTGATGDGGAELSGVRVLVVDDNEESRRLIGQVLEVAGATVVETASVTEALAAYRRDGFDVVVSDIAMPDTDGYALMRELRRERRPPLSLALTAFATDADRDKAIQAGFNAHVAKPVLPQELVQEITSLVRGTRAA